MATFSFFSVFSVFSLLSFSVITEYLILSDMLLLRKEKNNTTLCNRTLFSAGFEEHVQGFTHVSFSHLYICACM